MVEALRKLLLAGLGTLDLTEEKARAVFNDLVARGEMSEKDAREVFATWSKRAGEQRGRMQQDIDAAVKSFKLGRIEARNDKTGNINLVVGRRSFKDAVLQENIEATIHQVLALRPSGVKGKLFKKVSLASTMSPGIRLKVAE